MSLRAATTRLLPSTHLIRAASAARSLSTTRALAGGGDSHGSHFDPPSGWLWGVPPGSKPEKEGWENIWYYGFCGGLVATVVAFAFKPDTSIETWALEEAKRRLQKEGVLAEDA